MAVKSSSPKYYLNSKDTLKQLSTLLPILLMFVTTVLYASGLRNETVRTVMLYGSLAFPALIIFSLLFSIPRLVYYQIDTAGVHVTFLGVFHKHIYWSDIGSIGPAAIGNVEGIGMMYVSSFNRRSWSRKMRQRMWGWDEVLANALAEDGTLFGPEIMRHFKKHLRATNRQIAE
ncbi:MAG TPA: hypothetical protein VJ841_03190 [Candidatus Saccharimonadales bacterium]|nr:hypothetical protein [Candidatus Saccharimonadales bacterium]